MLMQCVEMYTYAQLITAAAGKHYVIMLHKCMSNKLVHSYNNYLTVHVIAYVLLSKYCVVSIVTVPEQCGAHYI
jgi:hypothetical protein